MSKTYDKLWVFGDSYTTPNYFVDAKDSFWGLTASMLIGNLFLLILNVPLVTLWVQIIRIPRYVLYPIVLAACAIGVYTINNNVNDIYITMFFGAIGLLFIWLELEPAPLMLGLVLGPMLEENFRRQMIISDGSWLSFVERPISATILGILALFLIYGLKKLLANK